MLERLVGILLMIYIHPTAAMAIWAAAGVPWWQSFIYVVLWTSLVLTLTYFGTGLAKTLNVLPLTTLDYFFGKEIKTQTNFQKKVVNWLTQQKTWVVGVFAFLPVPIPGFATAVYIAAKLLEIRHGYLLILTGNIFHIVLFIAVIYLGLGALFWK